MAREIESDARIDSFVLDTYLVCMCGLSAILNAAVIGRLGIGTMDIYRFVEEVIVLFGNIIGGEPGITVSLMVVTWIVTFVSVTIIAAVGLGALGLHFVFLYTLRGLVWAAERKQ